MRRGKVTALAVSAAVLAAGAVAAVAPAGSAATTSAAAAVPTIAITPGVTHPMEVMATPSQANCVTYGFYHCLTPQQVEGATETDDAGQPLGATVDQRHAPAALGVAELR